MKSLFQNLLFFSMLSVVVSVSIPGIIGPDIDLGKDSAQYEACKTAADQKNTFAAVRYGGGPPITVKYNECFPTRRDSDGQMISSAVFCQSATCYTFADRKCTTGPSLPTGIPFVAPVDIPIVADWDDLFMQSSYCAPNDLPHL